MKTEAPFTSTVDDIIRDLLWRKTMRFVHAKVGPRVTARCNMGGQVPMGMVTIEVLQHLGTELG